MAMFVHLTPEKNIKRIRSSGIKPSRFRGGKPDGIFAMPVSPNFYVSHQWLRELKAHGQRTIQGIYFRIPDEQQVYIGHYNANHQKMTASQAIGLVMRQENAEGYEVIVPRKVLSKEIHKVRSLPQVLGWRYYPSVRQADYCACPICVRPGTVRSRIKNRIWEAQQ